MPINPSEVWMKLRRGESLELSQLPTIDGRIDLRGLSVDQPQPEGPAQVVGPAQVQSVSGVIKLQGVHWSGIDFSNAQLGSLRIRDSVIENCVFDDAVCQQWVLVNTSVKGTRFRRTNLLAASLGTVTDGRLNSFVDVDFARADLRQAAFGPSLFERCDFSNAKLNNVEFGGGQLIDCKFAGHLRDVIFHAHPIFGGKGNFPQNEMLRVDFREAILHFVEFRDLDMLDVQWPKDGVVIDDYRSTLDRVLALLRERSDIPAQRLAAVLGSKRKWAGPNQKRGFIGKEDLLKCYGPDGVEVFLALAQDGRHVS